MTMETAIMLPSCAIGNFLLPTSQAVITNLSRSSALSSERTGIMGMVHLSVHSCPFILNLIKMYRKFIFNKM